MRNLRNLACFMVAVMVTVLIGGLAYGEDVVLKAPVESAETMIDKNGNEYVRLIITETRELGGVEYDAGVPVMAFGDAVAQAKDIAVGDQLAVVADKSGFEGRTSYSIRAFINE